MEFITALVLPQLKMFFEEDSIPTKEVADLHEDDFIVFQIKKGVKMAKIFGVYKSVSNEWFVINNFEFVSGTQPGVVYQVQKRENGTLFLQGAKKKINYS